MAYNKEEIYNQILSVIETHKIKHFTYLDAYVAPEISTLYLLFPLESDEFNTIKRALEKNRITSKQRMTDNWEDSDNPTLQIAAFKLLCSDEERKRLSTNYTDVTTNGKDLNIQLLTLNPLNENDNGPE